MIWVSGGSVAGWLETVVAGVPVAGLQRDVEAQPGWAVLQKTAAVGDWDSLGWWLSGAG